MTKYALPVFTILLLAPPLPAEATALTCTPPGAYAVPRTQEFTGSASGKGGVDRPFSLYPGLRVNALKATTADIEIVRLTIRDEYGTTYSKPIPRETFFGPTWKSPTPVPKGSASITFDYTIKIVPADGSTQSSPSAYNVAVTGVWMDAQDDVYSYTDPRRYPATYVGTTTQTYNAPDQHDFGDLPPSSSGLSLVLPAPSSGNLIAKILWNGPTGTSMTRKIGTAGPINVQPGSTYQLDTAGKGLQLDLKASDTASPGEITGNLTLTLTCP